MGYEPYRNSYNAELRRARRRAQRRLRFALVLALLLLLSALITRIIDGGKRKAPAEQAESTPAGESILAPLPFENSTFVTVPAEPRQFGPHTGGTLQSIGYQQIARKECGQVSTSYFSDAAFLGDSITEGFTEYSINMSGALICGYVGGSPNQIVNGAAMKHPERGSEVPLDLLRERQPAKLYVLMGANALSAQGNDDSFLAYYGKMLDMLKEALPNTVIYVQALTPVQPKTTEKSPGLENSRLQSINDQIARMAYERGLQFLDLYSAFVDENNELSADYAQPDGLHFTVSGYEHWVDYLCRHTVYSPDNPWLPGSAYAEVTVSAQQNEENAESAAESAQQNEEAAESAAESAQ